MRKYWSLLTATSVVLAAWALGSMAIAASDKVKALPCMIPMEAA